MHRAGRPPAGGCRVPAASRAAVFRSVWYVRGCLLFGFVFFYFVLFRRWSARAPCIARKFTRLYAAGCQPRTFFELLPPPTSDKILHLRSPLTSNLSAFVGREIDARLQRALAETISHMGLICSLPLLVFLPMADGQVGGVVETNRPDTKNAQYQACIKQGDLLLNRVQKLGRVVDA